MKKENPNIVTNRKSKKRVGWIITASILGATTLLSGGWAIYSTIENSNLKTNLNTIYQKSYYDFYDQLNNTEIKMNKLINTNNPAMQEKLLQEISKNANDAQASLNNLPISVNGMEKCLTFINQVAGYTSTLSKQLANGKSLKSQDKATLTKLNSSISSMRRNLSQLSNQIQGGYDILSNSIKLDGDYNNFTISLQSVNTSDVEYPTMIYDGPFAESQVNKKVKGLNLPEVDKEKAQDNLSVITKISKENLNFTNENHGRFACYNFEWKDENDNLVFAQVSKNGGKLLNMTSMSDNKDKNLGLDEAITSAKQFLKQNGINDTYCVWSDIVGGNAYLNFAPIQNDVILYPDLVKLKIDLADGKILGYEATGYYTNHTNRSLGNFAISKQNALEQIDSKFKVDTVKKALAPIEFSEVLCWEIKCDYAESVYYFYIDANTGQTVNILKVIQTNDGSKLM